MATLATARRFTKRPVFAATGEAGRERAGGTVSDRAAAKFQSVNSRAKTDWVADYDCERRLFSPMHGYRGKLTDQQMLDVLAHIRSVATPDFVS